MSGDVVMLSSHELHELNEMSCDVVLLCSHKLNALIVML
jgi:hypothetical protein